MKDKKFLALSVLFFLMFFAAIGVLTLDQPTRQILRAKNTNPSPLKSFVAIPLQIGKAGVNKLKISVFIRDINGAVLSNRQVIMTTTPSTTVSPADTQTTDSLGMVQFFIESTDPGKIQLTITDISSNMTLANVPTVEFVQ